MPDGRAALPRAHYASVTTPGPWWTEHDPSLKMPRVEGGAVAIWSVGDGPSVLLVAPAGCTHDVWVPISLRLREFCTVHALDREATSFTDDVDHMVTAAEAVGAQYLVGYLGDVEVLREAARHASDVCRILALTPAGDDIPTGSDAVPVALVHVSTGDVEALTAVDAARLIGHLGVGRDD